MVSPQVSKSFFCSFCHLKRPGYYRVSLDMRKIIKNSEAPKHNLPLSSFEDYEKALDSGETCAVLESLQVMQNCTILQFDAAAMSVEVHTNNLNPSNYVKE